MKRFLFIVFVLPSSLCLSQKSPAVSIIQDSIPSSFRGLSVPSDNVVWVSGSNGTIGRSTDAGLTWNWMIVPGFEKRDFRDIEAFDSLTAVIMAVDNPGNILKTTDGGKNWKVVFHKAQEGMFLDAMDFKGTGGVCIGDPVKGKDSVPNYYITWSKDTGNTWTETPFSIPGADDRAIFAASGTNIFLNSTWPSNFFFITGGIESRIYFCAITKKFVYSSKLPLMKGRASTGAFSVVKPDDRSYYVTGGDYEHYWKDSGNVIYTTNAGRTWKRSSVHGYRSCIIQTDKKTFITCGTNGVDISFNRCRTWKLIHGDGAKGKDGFNVCAKSKTGKAVYFAGTGRIGKLIP